MGIMQSFIGMTSSMSSNPSNFIDETIEKQIYYPPQTSQKEFDSLTTSWSYTDKTKTNDGTDISYVVIVPEKNPKSEKYIVFSHGNGDDIYGSYYYCRNLANTLGVNVICYDYPGYGQSGGIPSEQGCYDALECIVDNVLIGSGVNPINIFLIGQSLGTGPTMNYVARKHKWSAKKWSTPVMVISPYKTICKVVSDTSLVYPIDKFTTERWLSDITCPVKICHGEDDKLINISHGKTIYENLKNPMKPCWLPRIGHNDILNAIPLKEFQEMLNYTIIE
jgi:abhydrolase domain-containing protein 17